MIPRQFQSRLLSDALRALASVLCAALLLIGTAYGAPPPEGGAPAPPEIAGEQQLRGTPDQVAREQDPLGQEATEQEAAEPARASAEEAADSAVRDWLARRPVAFDRLAGLDAEQLCRELPGIVTAPPPPAGTDVNLDDRVERTTAEDGEERVFTYAASLQSGQLDVVEVRLRPTDEGWEAVRVGFRSDSTLTGVRAWLQTPAASWTFIALTGLVLAMLFAKNSPLRRWLRRTREAVREHRRLVIVTVLAFYGLFGLGVLSGSTLPDSCDVAVVQIVEGAITSLGATAAYGSGDVPRAAAVTFYQNFVVVTLSVTFTLAAVLGVPAYIYAAFSFFVQGVPFGLIGGGAPGQILTLLVVLVLELTAYFFVVSGGGMLLATIWRGGFGRLPDGFRKLLSTLPVAMLLLLVGAWFEATALILGF